jgi:hypothetical protein
MKDEKDLNSTKMDQRGKTPERKKNPTGAWMFVLCCKKTVVDRDMKRTKKD